MDKWYGLVIGIAAWRASRNCWWHYPARITPFLVTPFSALLGILGGNAMETSSKRTAVSGQYGRDGLSPPETGALQQSARRVYRSAKTRGIRGAFGRLMLRYSGETPEQIDLLYAAIESAIDPVDALRNDE